MLTLVVDCMGSDAGSSVTVQGILDFLKINNECNIIAVGKKEELTLLEGNPKIEIVDARDVAPMTISPLEVMRARESSLYKAVNIMRERKCDGVISAGSTGGFLSCATIKLKMIEGISRAALVSPFPTKDGTPTAILDIGASNENTADQLVQFARMGRLYCQHVLDIKEPKVYLLSNGIEDEKGSPEVKEAHRLLKESNFPGFKGNVEARDALDGHCDVIVTSGFTGNVFLKSSEGMAKMMSSMIKKAFKRNIFSKIGYLLSHKGFDDMKEKMDYHSYGGAILLGVNGVVVKAHGSANAYSFKCALNVAYRMAKNDIVSLLKKGE